MRRIAAISALVLAGGLVGPSAAVAEDQPRKGDAGDLRWIGVEDHFAIVLPDGQTFTGDEEPPGGEEQPIPVGAQAFISEALYATDDGEKPGEEIGRTHIECTAQVVMNTFLCDIAFVLHDGSQLHGTVHFGFTEQDENEAFALDIAATGGTGQFFGATGEVSLLDITPPEDEEAETTTLYEPDLVLLTKK